MCFIHRRQMRASEVEARLSCSLGERLDPPVVLPAAAVKADCANAQGPCPLTNDTADDGRSLDVRGATWALRGDFGLKCASRHQSPRVPIIDDLRVDVGEADVNVQPRPLGRPDELAPGAHMSLVSLCVPVDFSFHL